MARFEESFYLPDRPETIGASLESAQELVDLSEECFLLKSVHPEEALGHIAAQGTFASYLDVVHALEQRYVLEYPPRHSLEKGPVYAQATHQWKRYIQALRPELHALIQEFNVSGEIPDPHSNDEYSLPSRWFSRSLVYRTVMSRKGLERLRDNPEQSKKLGKQTLATLEALTAMLRLDEGYGDV